MVFFLAFLFYFIFVFQSNRVLELLCHGHLRWIFNFVHVHPSYTWHAMSRGSSNFFKLKKNVNAIQVLIKKTKKIYKANIIDLIKFNK